MVAGYSKLLGLWVVTPISMEPDHLSTSLSMRILAKGNEEKCKYREQISICPNIKDFHFKLPTMRCWPDPQDVCTPQTFHYPVADGLSSRLHC